MVDLDIRPLSVDTLMNGPPVDEIIRSWALSRTMGDMPVAMEGGGETHECLCEETYDVAYGYGTGATGTSDPLGDE